MAIEDIYPEEQIINSLVGPGSKFKGDLEVQGLVRVDGDYTGAISSSGKILIGQTGRFEGTLNARIVVIGGIVRGNVYARHRVVLLRGCIVLGNVYAPRLVIEELALFDGYLHVNGHEPVRGEQKARLRTPQRLRARDVFSNFLSGNQKREENAEPARSAVRGETEDSSESGKDSL